MSSYKTLGALLIGSLLWIASPAGAKGLSQSFADVGYLRVEADDFDMNAGTVNAAFELYDYFSLRGGFTRGKTEDFDTFNQSEPSDDSPDFTEFRVGIRPHYSFSDRGDVFVDLIYFNNKLNGDKSNTDIGGIYAAGIRYRLFKKAELLLAGEHRSGDVDETFVVIGPVIKLTKKLSLNIKTSQSTDDKDYFAGIRINF
jgi:hypothetical protein